MKKILALVLVLVFACALFAGCGQSGSGEGSAATSEASSEAAAESSAESSESSQAPASSEEGGEAPAASGEEIKIGLITMDLSNEFFAHVVEGMEALMEQTGNKINITVADGKSSPDVQAQAFDNFIASGQDIIMSSTLDPLSIEDAATRAMEQGIIVGTYPVMEGMDTCLTWNEYQWGYDLGDDAGKWIAEKLGGEATIACFYQAETPSALDRYYGYMDGVLAHNDESKITFLEPVNAITPAPATTAMESLIQANPDIKVVLATADNAAIAAYEVLKATGKLTDDMYIGGCDGDAMAIDLVLEGTPYRSSSASSDSVADLWYGFVQNAVRAYLGLDYVYYYPAPTKLIKQEDAQAYKDMTNKFVLDTAIAEHFGITEVPIGSIGDNYYTQEEVDEFTATIPSEEPNAE